LDFVCFLFFISVHQPRVRPYITPPFDKQPQGHGQGGITLLSYPHHLSSHIQISLPLQSMFGARNGTGHPASNAQRPSHNSSSNNNNSNGDNTPSLRRRLSSDSINSVGSAGSAPVTNRAPTPSLHHPQQSQQQQQQLHQLAKSLGPSGAGANKELNIQVVVRIR